MALCAVGMLLPGIPMMFVLLAMCGRDLNEEGFTAIVALIAGIALSAMLYCFFPFADVCFGLGTVATVWAVWQLVSAH